MRELGAEIWEFWLWGCYAARSGWYCAINLGYVGDRRWECEELGPDRYRLNQFKMLLLNSCLNGGQVESHIPSLSLSFTPPNT